MIRLCRHMVGDIWQTGDAHNLTLIHPHRLLLADQDVAATLERINPSLSNARSRDVADMHNNAVAQAMAREAGAAATADAAK